MNFFAWKVISSKISTKKRAALTNKLHRHFSTTNSFTAKVIYLYGLILIVTMAGLKSCIGLSNFPFRKNYDSILSKTEFFSLTKTVDLYWSSSNRIPWGVRRSSNLQLQVQSLQIRSIRRRHCSVAKTRNISKNRQYSHKNIINSSASDILSQDADECGFSLPTINPNNLQRLYVGTIPTEARVVSKFHQLNPNESISKSKRLYRDATVYLTPDQTHYVVTVLRLLSVSGNRGERGSRSSYIRVFDESQEEWLAQLVLLSENESHVRRNRKRDTLQVVAICRKHLRSSTRLHSKCWLCVATTKKKDRIRWMIEKTTELNCGGFLWMNTDYSDGAENSAYGSKSDGALPFDKIVSYAIEASEQSERLSIPQLISYFPQAVARGLDNKSSMSKQIKHVRLPDFLDEWNNQRSTTSIKLLICRERSKNSIPVWQALERIYQGSNMNDDTTTIFSEIDIMFLIGPEGGWSPSEDALFDQLLETDQKSESSSSITQSRSIYNISLGPAVLRAETAAVAATTAFMVFVDNHLFLSSNKT